MKSVTIVKGGAGSGNFDHRGRPGLVGGSAEAGVATLERLPEVDNIDGLVSYDVGDGEISYGYFITPHNTLIDTESGEGEHAELVNEYPETFGLTSANLSKYNRYHGINQALHNGYIRVRIMITNNPQSDDVSSMSSIQSDHLDTATLRRLQRAYDNGLLHYADAVTWEGSELSDLTVKWPEFIDAKRVVMVDGRPVLKQAVIVGKHLPGQHDQQSHDSTKGAARNLDYDAVIDRAIKDKQPLDSLAGDWLKENFDIPYEMNDWAQYDDRFTSIRDSYVVNDERTLRNNRALRNGDDPKSANWANRIDKICESKFKYDSQVYRSAALSQDIVDKIIQTKAFQDNGFMSVSGEKSLPEAYLNHRLKANKGALPVMFHIKAPAGSHVGLMDNGEFIFPRGTKIQIDSWKLDNGRYEFIGTAETP